MQKFKVSNSKSDLQTNSRSLAVMPSDRPYIIFYLSFVVNMSRLYRLYLAAFPRYYRFPKFKVVTVTTPTEGTICNPSAKPSHGKPVYKI